MNRPIFPLGLGSKIGRVPIEVSWNESVEELGCGGGKVVRISAYCSDDSSLIPAGS